MKSLYGAVLLITFMGTACSMEPVSEVGEAQYFDLSDVRLLPSPFLHAQELDQRYLLELDVNRLLAPFLREAGLESQAESYPNWENTGLDGHIGGHYLSALALMYASGEDETIKSRLDYTLKELKRCQDAHGNGYIGGVPGGQDIWRAIKNGDINAGAFSLNGKWVPLYNIHKTFAGLRDAFLHTGSTLALDMLIKMSDWAIQLVAGLSETQIQDMLRSEHGGLNETFADLAAITGQEQYLQLAKRFSHQSLLEPLSKREDILSGMHANTQIPKVIGFKRIAELTKDSIWSKAAEFFWEEVVSKRSVCIGGNSAYEHFHPADDFSRMIQGTQGPETCNTYNMLRLTKMLYQGTVDPNYIEYYERALYNHILASQHPKTGGLVYFTQMRPGHFRVYSQPHTSFWCCVGSGIENHAKYGEMIYAHAENALLVNLFIPSRLNWQEKQVQVTQETQFPEESATHLTIRANSATEFSLRLRKPQWLATETPKVYLNGKPLKRWREQDGYLCIFRKWEDGDRIDLELPMEVYTEQLPDKSNYFAFLYGPLVLAADLGKEGISGVFADESRGGHIAQGDVIPLKDIPIVVGDAAHLNDHLEPIPDRPLRFELGGLSPADKLEMMPFYQLHESRYILYFPQANEQELQRIQQKLAMRESAIRKLDSISVDVVACGEQQPESDHFMEQGDTWSGYMYDTHWREGPGSFSYQMRNEEAGAQYLYMQYLDIDVNRACRVYANGREIGQIEGNGESSQQLKAEVLKLPANLIQEKVLHIKVEGRDNAWMMKVAQLRLLTQKPQELDAEL